MGTLLQGELGFFVAIVLFTMALRWLWTLRTVTAEEWVYAGELKRRRSLVWALPIAVLLHSGPWALAVFGFLSWHLIRTEGWFGYGWGLLIGALFMATLAAVGLARTRRRNPTRRRRARIAA